MDTHKPLRDVFVYVSGAAIVPNWIATDDSLTLESRNLAHRLIVSARGTMQQPTQAEIAAQLGVTTRTVERWLQELRKSGYMSVESLGRCRFYRFHNERHGEYPIPGVGNPDENNRSQGSPIPRDRRSPVSGIDTNRVGFFHGTTEAQNANNSHDVVGIVHGGGGGHDLFNKEIQPTNQSRAAKKFVRPENEPYTEAETHMITHWRFSRRKAFALRGLNLADCKADYAIRWAAGGREGSIIEAWEAGPPPSAASASATQSSGPLDFAAMRRQYGDLYGPDESAPECKRDTLGNYWTVCRAPAEGPCVCDVYVRALDRTNPDVNQFLGECGL